MVTYIYTINETFIFLLAKKRLFDSNRGGLKRSVTALQFTESLMRMCRKDRGREKLVFTLISVPSAASGSEGLVYLNVLNHGGVCGGGACIPCVIPGPALDPY